MFTTLPYDSASIYNHVVTSVSSDDSGKQRNVQLSGYFDPLKEVPVSASQFPPPQGLNDIYNRHLFYNPDIFRNYILIYNCPMYSDLGDHSNPYICTLNNTNWKKLNKKVDLLNAQKLILKHVLIFHLLLPIHKSIQNRLHQINDYYQPHLVDFEHEVELKFVEADKMKPFLQSSGIVNTNRLFCTPISSDPGYSKFRDVFEKYHRDLNGMGDCYDDYFRTMYDDVKISYEYVTGLKASIASHHNEIICSQTIGIGGEQLAKKPTRLSISKKTNGPENNSHLINNNNTDTDIRNIKPLGNDLSRPSPQSLEQPVKATTTPNLAKNGNKEGDTSLPVDPINQSKPQQDEEVLLLGRTSSLFAPTPFNYHFSPDIICLLWQQEYECQYQRELICKSKKRGNHPNTNQKLTATTTSTTVQKIESGPFNLSRYTHFSAGLEITHRYLPDAQKAQQTFSIYSLTLSGEELRGIPSIPPPYHVLDRKKLHNLIENAKEFVTDNWTKQFYRQQFICYTPRPAVPTRVELSFLPSPPQKLHNLELRALNYSLSGTSYYDTFLRYLSLQGPEIEMYSECRLDKLKDIYVCELHHFKKTLFGFGKHKLDTSKVDVKGDLYSVQKLILKHFVITQRLLSLLVDMMTRLQTVMNDNEHHPLIDEWLQCEEGMIQKSQSVIPVVDYSSTLALLAVPFQEMFNCYHRYSYNDAWLLSGRKSSTGHRDLDQLKAKEIYQALFTNHLPLSYELIFRLKILLYNVYDRIVIVQSLISPRWVNEVQRVSLSKHVSPDILCCLWFQAYYKPLSSLDGEDQLDVQRKLLFRTPNCFLSAVEHHQRRSFSLLSLTLSEEENRTLFRPPMVDAVLDIHEIIKAAGGGFDGHKIPDWVNSSYSNRFTQYVLRPQIPTMRLPIPPIPPISVEDPNRFKSQNDNKLPIGKSSIITPTTSGVFSHLRKSFRFSRSQDMDNLDDNKVP